MKKLFMAAILCGASFFAANAQEITAADSALVADMVKQQLDNDKFWKRRGGLRLHYTTSHDLENKASGEKLESKFGFGIDRVWSIALHKKPIFDRIKFAAEIGLSLNYTQFDENKNFILGEASTGNSVIDEAKDELELGYHQADLGVKLGLGIIYRPFIKQDFRVQGFCHWTPSGSALVNDDDVSASFVSFMDYGVELSWKRFGVGVEMRQGTGKYKIMSDEVVEKFADKANEKINSVSNQLTGQDLINEINESKDEKFKLKTKALRVYLVVKF